MLNIDPTSELENAPDPYMVEQLVRAALGAMQRTSIPNITTSGELISASFTILDRMLLATRNMQSPEDQAFNTKEIARVLQELMVDYGQIPN